MPEYKMARLSLEDDVSHFDCGADEWDTDVTDFLKDDALRQQEKGLNVTWLCRLDGKLVGYTSLVASRIKLNSLFDWIAYLGLGEEPIRRVPCMMIARFAVDTSIQRHGVGKFMMSYARGAALKSSLGMRLATIDVDKRNDKGLQFWLSQGFTKVREGSESRFMIYDLRSDH